MSFLLGLKAKLAGLGALLLVVLGFFVRLKIVTAQRDSAVINAEVLKRRVIQHKQSQKIIRDEAVKLHSRTASIAKEIEKEDEDFEGIDSLTNSSTWSSGRK